MKNKLTVSIGIPAHNEKANIAGILADLLAQKTRSVVIKNIVVFADGCTDDTQSQVQLLAKKSHLIKLIDNPSRIGKSNGTNKLFENFDTDVAIIIDADTRVTDHELVEKLCTPIQDNAADLVSCPIMPLLADGFVSRSLIAGMRLKENGIRNFRSGQNIYACRGPIKALSKKLYKVIKLDSKVLADDMYTYVYATAHGFRFSYITNTEVWFKVPSNTSDHKSQSLRFMDSKQLMTQKIGRELATYYFGVPLSSRISQVLRTLISEHFWLMSYLSLYVLNCLIFRFNHRVAMDDKWQMAESTRSLHI